MGAKLRITLWVMALGCMAAANAQDMHIQFAEKVAIAAVAGQTEFDAFGRRFSITLENNSRLLTALTAAQKGEIPATQLLRGKIDGVPRSWVRIARVGGGLEGAIWDGQELYVVTQHASIAPYLTLPLSAGPSQTVVYRLSDTQVHWRRSSAASNPVCRAAAPVHRPWTISGPGGGPARTGRVDDFRPARCFPGRRQRIPEFVWLCIARHDAGAPNTVDGIFSEQVGVLLVPGTVRLDSGSTPFNTTNASQLLEKLGDYRASDVDLRAAGITHLMTGKDLDGNTAGIAFLDSLCDRQEGVSLSDSLDGNFFGALVMAHELGHNFGARHDGAAGSQCESTPSYFLMWPTINGSAQFSQCSLDTMRPVIERARAGLCIKPATYADLDVGLPASPYTVDTSSLFSLPVTVRSNGTVAAQNSRLRIDLPGATRIPVGDSVRRHLHGERVRSRLRSRRGRGRRRAHGDLASARERDRHLHRRGECVGGR